MLLINQHNFFFSSFCRSKLKGGDINGFFQQDNKERTCSICGTKGRDFAELVYSGEWIFYRGHVIGWCETCQEWICEAHTVPGPYGGAICSKCGSQLLPNY